jgi:hypothetical protein
MEGMPIRGWQLPFITQLRFKQKMGFHIFRVIAIISNEELPIILSNSLFALSVRFFTCGRLPIFSAPCFTPPRNVSQPNPITAKIIRIANIRIIHPIN